MAINERLIQLPTQPKTNVARYSSTNNSVNVAKKKLNLSHIFYLAIKHRRIPDNPVWYSKTALGVNEIAKFLQRQQKVQVFRVISQSTV